MAIPTVTLNEDNPAGGAYVRDGNDRICEYKKQNREIIEVDHVYPVSGQNDACGQHKQVTFVESADIGITTPVLGAETVSGKPELVYVSEDGDVQITKGGKLNIDALDVTLSAWATIMALIYPVGSIYTNATVSTNPGTLLGFGTWVAFGGGRVLVGVGTSDAVYAAAATGGESTHTLITAEMPAHTHTITINQANLGAGNYPYGPTSADSSTSGVSSSTGGGGTHNNLQPYIVVYFWKRTV